MKYGLLKYDATNNLGDEIQSLAAARFLPQIDYFIDREQMKNFCCDKTVKVIMNGWYMHNPKQWPPSADIEPLLISMHINKTSAAVVQAMFSGLQSYFHRYGKPVGARDFSTLELLQKNNVPSFFSGCMTLTLTRKEELSRGDYICVVDISEAAVDFLKTKTKRPIYRVSPLVAKGTDYKRRFCLANMLLDVYQNAHCVVTSRLHAALPCLALETPVLLLDDAPDQYRFSGLNELVRHCTEKELLTNNYSFNVECPGPNSSDYLKYRDKLIKDCALFTGIDNVIKRNLFDDGNAKAMIMESISEMTAKELKVSKTIRKIKQGKVWRIGDIL